MNNELMIKLERACRDRDFFILNKERIRNAYMYLEDVLANYIDICCNKFKSFKVNKTSYIYGSILTLGLAMTLSKEKFFQGALGSDPVENLSRDIFPLFVEAYNTTTLVEAKTQSHMLKGCIEEYQNIVKKLNKYVPGAYDSHFSSDVSDVKKSYFNQILKYCIDHKLEGFSDEDVVNELLPFLTAIEF